MSTKKSMLKNKTNKKTKRQERKILRTQKNNKLKNQSKATLINPKLLKHIRRGDRNQSMKIEIEFMKILRAFIKEF